MRRQPISILKPVKGFEPHLEENLESFFRLNYFAFELLFSIADAQDPARVVIENLIAKYPRVRARLTIGEVNVGPNPKVNNLIKNYARAKHDWILISDSNTRVSPNHLDVVTEEFTPDVGIVTALVAGRDPRGVGGQLEAVFLNTFYARWMMIAPEFNSPVVLGKSMLLRKSDAKRFGGLERLGRYLAEDQMAGQAMLQLGKKIKVMSIPITQPIGAFSLSQFWSRHLRWGRIRKSQAPLAYAFEPLLCSSLLSGLVGAWAIADVTRISYTSIAAAHFGVWFLADAFVMRSLGERMGFKSALAWCLRELSHLPLWVHIGLSNKVVWRGQTLRVLSGGRLESVDGSSLAPAARPGAGHFVQSAVTASPATFSLSYLGDSHIEEAGY